MNGERKKKMVQKMYKQSWSIKVFIYKFTASKYFNRIKINYFWSYIGLKFKQNVKVLIGFKIDKKNTIRNPIFFCLSKK